MNFCFFVNLSDSTDCKVHKRNKNPKFSQQANQPFSKKELNFNRLISANLSNYGKFALSKKNYKANLTAQYAPQATATKIISAFTTNPHLLLLSFFMDCIISLACLWLF